MELFAHACDRNVGRKAQRWDHRKAALIAVLGSLCFAVGCGSTGPSQTSTTAPEQSSTGGFTNASLKGSYTYDLAGVFLVPGTQNDAYQRDGTFVADGNGNITSGVDDLTQQSAALTTTPITGSYSIGADGTGLLTLNVATTTIQLAITLVSNSLAYVIEFDSMASGSGAITLQTASAFSTTPSGTFVFYYRAQQPVLGVSTSVIGNLVVQTGGSASGNQDFVREGTFGSTTITGSLTASDATGKGTLTTTDSNGVTSNFFYYVIDSSTLNLIEVDPGILANGRVELQSGGPFDNGSMKGSFVFRSGGNTPLETNGADSVGVFTADGSGNITNGSYDSVQNGTPISVATVTGTYSMESTGRITLALNPSGISAIPEIAWLVSPSSAFFLVDLPNTEEVGHFDQQQTSSFSAATLNNPFCFTMSGRDGQIPPQVDRLGVAIFDGQSSVALTDYFVNRGGSRTQTQAVNGSYAVGSNGRVTGSISGVTNALVMYLVSNNSGYLILEDTGAQVSGNMTEQTFP